MLTRFAQSVLLLIIMSYSLGGVLYAAPPDVDSNVREFTILSQYRDLTTHNWGHDKLWQFLFSTPQNCQVYLQNETSPRLELSYSSDRRIINVSESDGTLHNRTVAVDPHIVLLSHGYPIPFDDIAAGGAINAATVVERRTIAGVAFSEELTTRVVPALFQDVISQGFVRVDSHDLVTSDQLYWVELYRQNQRIIRQLWQPNLAWWLYEETQERRSWLQSIQ